jgi:aspartate carbamoyltransferase regulatory subunit
MAIIQEQIARARSAGYDDADITKHLGTLPDYSSKVKTALDSGYKPADILSYLEGPPKRQNVDPEKGNLFSQGEVMYSPEGIPLNTSNYGSAPTGGTATAAKVLTTMAGVPINYAMGAASIPLNVANIVAKATGVGRQTTEQALAAQKQITQGVNQQSYSPVTQVANFAGEVFNPITMAVPGALGNALARYAPNVSPAIANALRSGGFSTGVSRLSNAPVGVATNILPRTMANRLADTGAKLIGGGVVGGATNALISSDDIESGVGYGAAAPLVLGPLGKAVSTVGGKVVDLATGQTIKVEAGKRMREMAGQTINEIRAANAQAPLDITSAQATANITNDVWQAFNMFMQSKDKKSLFTIIDKKQDLANLEKLAALAGGNTATEIKQAIVEAKKALNELTTPLRKIEIDAANQANKTLTQINPKIEQKQGSIVQGLQQGGMAQTNAAQQANLAAGNTISPRLGGTGNVSPAAYPVEGYPRIPGRYTENQQRVPEFQGAADDLAIITAQRKSELAQLQYVKDSLAAHGMEPIDTNKIIQSISAKLNDPKIGPSDVNTSVLTTVANKIQEWTARNYGVIDAEALNTIRKEAVNEAIAAKLGTNADPKASARYAADLLGQIKPLIDDAIEKAGGTGWRNYLKTHEIGAQEINIQKLYGAAADMYRTNKQGFVDLIKGNNPDEIEKIFGPGSFNILTEALKNEMRAGPAKNVGEKLKVLQKIAADIERDKSITEAANRGRGALDTQKLGFSEKIPGFVGFLTAVFKKVSQTLEGKVESKITETIINGLKNGKSANEVLDTLPAEDRFKVLEILKNSPEWNALTGVATERVVNQNKLAPEQPNQNALAR